MKYFKDENGNPFAYEDDVKDGQVQAGLTSITATEYDAIVNTPEKAITQMLADGEVLIEAHIQAPINAYNEANGVKFAHTHSCANYKDETGYTHQAFCQQAWNFNVAVWEAGRLIQVDVLAGTISAPTPEEFIAMLPVFSG